VTLYDVLGMPPGASHADLRRAYLRAARRTHPDVHATADAATRRAAETQMRSLNEAWAVLSDAQRRRDYDRQLADRQRAAAHRTAPPPPGYGGARPAAAGAYGTHGRPGSRPSWPTTATPHRHPTGSGPHWAGAGFAGFAGRTPPAAPGATPFAGGAPGAGGVHQQADWRRFASPGPALHRTLGARLATLVPALLVILAVSLAALGVLMAQSSLITLAGATALVASVAFLAAPILAMKEGRRHGRRSTRRPRTVPGFGGSAGA
jgi:hypothetical protein